MSTNEEEKMEIKPFETSIQEDIQQEVNKKRCSEKSINLIMKIIIIILLIIIAIALIVIAASVANDKGGDTVYIPSISEAAETISSPQPSTATSVDPTSSPLPTRTDVFSSTNCSSKTCQYNEFDMDLSSTKGHPLRIFQVPNQILPGYQFLSYAFNQLQGIPPTDLILQGNYRQIIDFSFDNQQISSGTKNYLVPDQFDLPSISSVCDKQTATSSVSSSMSTSSMTSEAMESTGESSFEASVSASGYGASLSASFGMSASHSNSRSSTASRSAATEGKTESTYTYSKALLYSTQLQWGSDTISDNIHKKDFKTQLDRVNNVSPSNITGINKEVVLLIGNFGTHVLDLARMGARCRSTTFFSSSMSNEAYSAASDAASSSSNSYSGSVSGSFSGWGVSVSASASYSQSSSESSSSSNEESGESSRSVESSSETLDCVGEVDVTSICGDMLGTQNQPSLVGYRMKRIWTLPYIIDNYPMVPVYMNQTLHRISESGEECGTTYCGGVGICGIDKSFWTLLTYQKWENDWNFSRLWNPEICLNQYQFGTSLIRSGYNVSTQMNQCNDTKIVKWGDRYETSKIRYDPFCEGDMQVAIGLNLINRSVSFEGTVSNIKSNRFTITYGLLSHQQYQCTSVGGVSYGLFCENINVKVGKKTIGPFNTSSPTPYPTAAPTEAPTDAPSPPTSAPITLSPTTAQPTVVTAGPSDAPSFSPSIAPTNPVTAPPTSPPLCYNVFGGNWTLVRHAYAQWHPATDNLAGSDVYGTPDMNPQSTATWSIEFNNLLEPNGSTLFMFSNGGCTEWLVTRNDQFLQVALAPNPINVTILASQINAGSYAAKWWNRPTSPEDPWISWDVNFATGDGSNDNDMSRLYGEANYSAGNSTARFLLPDKSVNVWLRKAKTPQPTEFPTMEPTMEPTVHPTYPTSSPTSSPTDPTSIPTTDPTKGPSDSPTGNPTTMAPTTDVNRVDVVTPELPCSVSEARAISFISGYDYHIVGYHGPSSTSLMGIQSSVSTTRSTVSVEYVIDYDVQFDISVIHFCYDKSAIRYGTETFNVPYIRLYAPSTLYPGPVSPPTKHPTSDGSKPSPAPSAAPSFSPTFSPTVAPQNSPISNRVLQRQWIRFEPEALQCTTVNIFTAFSFFSENIGCSMAIWTENASGAGFNLVLGIWNAHEPHAPCAEVNSPIKISWFAVCQNL